MVLSTFDPFKILTIREEGLFVTVSLGTFNASMTSAIVSVVDPNFGLFFKFCTSLPNNGSPPLLI